MTANDAPYDLAVIGGGPAGVATVLAAGALSPQWRVLWCRGPEEAARAFLPAYGGNSLRHRLNVPVERMGLDAEAPVDFFDWLRREHPARAVEPGQFVPRRWFGEYLEVLRAAVDVDADFGAVLGLRREGDDWRITLAGNGREGVPPPRLARRVALCLGMPAGLPMPNAPRHWVSDPWAWWRALPVDGVPLRDADTVLVVGSGLTAVDMVLGLRERGFRGTIRVVSTGGRWSQAHAPTAPLAPDVREALDDALDEAVSAREVLRVLRQFASRHPWRAVIDALRVETNARWAALGLDQQRRVLRHAFGVWNRHRHRMAPDVCATLEADAALSLESGRIGVDAAGRIVKRDRWGDTVLDVALALDCRGPGFRAALSGDSLLAGLVRDGVLEAHPLGTGVRSPAEPSLAVVGAARFGERFETSAVPELRQQAVEVVRRWVA
ncbi:FAD/NAD(P)-binding protein [Silanimonas algicola]